MNDAWKVAVLENLQEVFRKQFLDDTLKVTEETSPMDIEDWDSMAHINLLLAIEKVFDVKFSIQNMSDIDNVKAIISVLREQERG